jgi:hypothetical protein
VLAGARRFYFETQQSLFEETLRNIATPLADAKVYLTTLTGPFRTASAHRQRRELAQIAAVCDFQRFQISHIVDRRYETFFMPLF